MKIMLIRHAESMKNVENKFSTAEDKEYLSEIGMKQAEDIALDVEKYLLRKEYRCSCVYAANTTRAIMTAEKIASKLNKGIVRIDEFKSLKNSDNLIGLDEKSAREKDAMFMHELSLNRAGVFNAYKHTSNFSEKIIKDHEKKVYDRFCEIIDNSLDDIAIIVLHHSSLTDIVINLARKYYEYPEQFYGIINAELAHLYLFDFERGEFDLADAESSELQICD